LSVTGTGILQATFLPITQPTVFKIKDLFFTLTPCTLGQTISCEYICFYFYFLFLIFLYLFLGCTS